MSQQSDSDETAGGGFLNHLPIILWQRRWFAIPPLVLLTAAGVILAVMLPAAYRSSATLLVQSQELPANLVNSPVTTLIDQRIAKIRQQVLSRGDLIQLIEQNGLYAEERRTTSLSDIVDTMRKATAIQAVAGDVGQAPSGNGTNTIAFTMSYDYRDPNKAQAVMQSLVNRFMEIDTSNTEGQATNTVSFLRDQATNLQKQIADIEGQITAIKARNGSALASAGVVTSADSGSYDGQIAMLQSQNRQLAAQAGKQGKDPLVAAAEAQLAAARATYTEGHPDVVAARQRLNELKQSGGIGNAGSDSAEIRSEINANNAAIASLERARSTEGARASSSIALQSRAPAILEQVAQLDSKANNLRLQYQDVSANVLKAQNSERMAQEQKGERLSIIDPPVVPDQPVSPNRPLLIAGGILAGLGLGLVLAMLIELILQPIRGVSQIEAAGLETLAVVPTFKRTKSRFRRFFASDPGEEDPDAKPMSSARDRR